MPLLRAEIEDPENEDNYMIEDLVSPKEIKGSFTSYKGSLKRFRISAE